MPFGYFGRKGKLAKFYPPPRHGVIVEPFAGSAAYSLHADHWQNRVILVDNDTRVIRLWLWLVDSATEDDIRSLPDYAKGDLIEGDSPLADLVRLSAPSENWKGKSTITSRMERDWNGYRNRVIASLPKIRHWEIIGGDYRESPDIKATWFVDPPYSKVGYGYEDSRDGLDYNVLREWVLSRDGSVIACENHNATWLPFRPLRANVQTINNTPHSETVWLSAEIGGDDE